MTHMNSSSSAPRRSGEILVRRAQLRGLRPFPAWNGSIASSPASGGSSSLCSVLTDSGALVVVAVGGGAGQAGSASLPASAQVRKVLTPPASQPVDCVSQCWSSDGRFLAAAFGTSVVAYNVQDGFELAVAFGLRYSAASIALVYVPHTERGEERHYLVVGSAFGAELYQLDLLSPFTTPSSTPRAVKTPVATVYFDVAVGLVEASPDGRFLAIGSIDGRLFVRDLSSLTSHDPSTSPSFGTEVLHKLLPSPRVTGLAFSPCGESLLAATRKGNVFVFRYQATECAWQWYKPARHLAGNPKASGATSSAAASTQTLVTWWTPEVFAVCSRSAPSRIELFDLNSGKLLHSLAFSNTTRRRVNEATAKRVDDEAIQSFNEEPQVTGLCVTPASPRRLLCHDTSCNLLTVDWPFLEFLAGSGQEEPESTR